LSLFTLGASSLVNHAQNVERQPTIEFVNDLGITVCAINLWREAGPAADATANWLELTEVPELEPGARVRVGMQPRDALYRLRAVDCDGFVRSDSIVQVTAGQTLQLKTNAPPPPPPAAMPSSL
jgi:hypothetical protein